MWKTIWNLVNRQVDLLSEAHREAVAMLDLDREMFIIVQDSLDKDLSDDELLGIRRMDLTLNEAQQEIRRKVFEHLAIAKGDNLLSGLILTSIVIDLERIGDYSKNIGELVQAFPGQLGFGERQGFLDNVRVQLIEIFDLTRRALKEQSESSSVKCMDKHNQLAIECDKLLEDIMQKADKDSSVTKADLAIVLMLRYFKRVSAHLKNIASATIAPFPMIGYHLGGKEKDDLELTRE